MPGPDESPAIVFKNTRMTITKPTVPVPLMRQNIDQNSKADIHKMLYLTPIHRRGSKLIPKQYRPVSLTLHKVFERLIENT